MKLRQLLQNLPQSLRRDGEIILAHLLRKRPSELHLLAEEEVPRWVEEEFTQLLQKRREGISTAHLTGEWDFFGRTFKVMEGVLVPRPETELLVEKALELIPENERLEGLEVGGGTGAISITLLLERPLLRMTVDDVNPKAVSLMRENAKLHGVEDRIDILEGSIFEPVRGRVFNFLISNPPYIPESAWESLPPEVKREGKLSLIGGKRGTEFYEEIAGESKKYIKKGGFVALEIGHDQGEEVKRLLEEADLKEVMIYKDYSGQDRVAVGWNL